MGLILRNIKGSELTWTEVDGNFSQLLYDVTISGTQLQFFTNNGVNDVLKRSFDLSQIPGFAGVTIYKDDTEIETGVTELNFFGAGIASITTDGNNKVNIEVDGGGDTYTLEAGAKSGTSVPLNLDAASGADSTVNFTEGPGIILTQTAADEITIEATATEPTFTNTNPTPLNFPGNSPFDTIPSGTTFNAKTFEQMMNLMLYPTLYPTLTAPSNGFNITTTPNISGNLREIGTVYDMTSTFINLNSTFNRGSINPAYTTNGFRSGLPNGYVYTGANANFTIVSTSLTNSVNLAGSYTILQGNNTWTSAVSYDAGEQPLDSVGDNFDSPLPAGTTSPPKSKSLIGVYPVFATTANITTLTKQALQLMSVRIQVAMVAETGGNKQTVDIPVAFSTITGLQQFNTLSGSWDTISLSTFTITSVTKTIQGNTVNYKRYTHNGSTTGGRSLRFLV
ncbi:MAG: hypothetical protein GY936_17795 [Ignavibacteriae bacterium]|nr:hypothetical protein [Candidatus Scalindua sp.]MCP5064297.1 hypothetical protein [Ignavibacteriota bacterium]